MPNTLKEIGIGILLLVVISLLLIIILIDAIPQDVDVPTKIQPYELSEDIQEELKETLSQDSQDIVKTYYIDSSSLGTYESYGNYDKGRPDPFRGLNKSETNTSNNDVAQDTTGTKSTTNNSTTSSANNNSNNTNNNNNQNTTNNDNTSNTETSTSQGRFFNTGGKD